MFPSKGAVWLWMNRGGSGLLWGNEDRFMLKPGMYALTGGGSPADWVCHRHPGAHDLEILVIAPEWLKDRMGRSLQHPSLSEWLTNDCPVAFCGLMGAWENELFDALAMIPTAPGSAKFLAEAKILEWAAVRLYRPDTPKQSPAFCAALRDRNPVQRALAHLAAHLDQALDLAALARHVGIAPHYLSRKVSAETGKTLQRHLRRLRIERACELLVSGKTNITETSLDVGYQSMSHFTKAFREETGTSPKAWLKKR
jgi:AraC-like DNA-binding protein